MRNNKQDKTKSNIKVTVKNKPDEKTSKQKIKELSEFLSNAWHIKINSK